MGQSKIISFILSFYCKDTIYETINERSIYFSPEHYVDEYSEDENLYPELSTKSDIWTLGFFISELFSGKPHLEPNKTNHIFRAQNLIINNKPFKLPECLEDDIREIVLSCLNYDKNTRPLVSELLIKVTSLIDQGL